MGGVLKEAKSLIAESKLDKAIALLRSRITDEDEALQLDMQSAKLSKLKKDERMGILSSSDANIQRNQITYALLSLINDLKESDLTNEPKAENQQAPTVINIINSSNVNTGNINTGGGDVKIGDGN